MITDMRNNVSPSTKDLQEREISVQLKGVSKIYPLKKDKPTFFEKIVSNGDAGKFVALNDLNLNIYKGFADEGLSLDESYKYKSIKTILLTELE